MEIEGSDAETGDLHHSLLYGSLNDDIWRHFIRSLVRRRRFCEETFGLRLMRLDLSSIDGDRTRRE